MEHLSQYDSDVEGEVEVHHVTAVPRQALPAVRAEPLVPRARVREPTTPGFVIPVTNRVRRIEAEPAAPKKSRKKKKVRWAKAIEASKPPTPVEEAPDRNLRNVPEGRARTAGDYSPSDEPMAVEAAAPPVDEPMADAQALDEFFEERPLFDEETRAKLRWSPSEEPPLDELRQVREEDARHALAEGGDTGMHFALERISTETAAYLQACREGRQEEYRRTHPSAAWVDEFLAARASGREEDFLFHHPAGFAQEDAVAAAVTAEESDEDEEAVRRRRKGKAPMFPGEASGEPPEPPRITDGGAPQEAGEPPEAEQPPPAEQPVVVAVAEGVEAGVAPEKEIRRRLRVADDEPLPADDPGWMRLERVPTATHIASALTTHRFSFVCYQGRVRPQFSRDVRVPPRPALLGVPQNDILPFKWTADFWRMTPQERRANVPWWDPRVSEEMMRRNLFGFTREEKKLRAKASVNRRNLIRIKHQWYRIVEIVYSGPKMTYKAKRNRRLNHQRHEMRKVGQSVLDNKQHTYPSEDELTDGVSDGGTPGRVRRGLRRRPRAARPPAARRRQQSPQPEPAAPIAAAPVEAWSGTRPSGRRTASGRAETTPSPGAGPVDGLPTDGAAAAAAPGATAQEVPPPEQVFWDLSVLRASTFHNRQDAPNRRVVFNNTMRDRLLLLNSVAIRHILGTAYSAPVVNDLYSAEEHLALDAFIWRDFQVPTRATRPGTDGAGPSSAPPTAPGATGHDGVQPPQ